MLLLLLLSLLLLLLLSLLLLFVVVFLTLACILEIVSLCELIRYIRGMVAKTQGTLDAAENI